ncbi:MAG: hypothetical protein ACE5DX_04765, partial [Candidatus Dojkabacteria bacterium]
MQNLRKKLKSLFAIAMLSVLLLSGVATTAPAHAGFTECGVPNVCFYKDVYDNAAKVWVPDQVTAYTNDYISFNIGIWNTTGLPITDVTFTDTLPSVFEYVPDSMTILGYTGSYNQYDLFGSGINVGPLLNTESVQVIFQVQIKETPTGTQVFTNTGSVDHSGGSDSNTASVEVTSFGPTPGKLLVNEINHAPLADWSQDSDYR